MKVVAIIQARMGSTRLPGKILKKVLDKTLLEYQLERVRRAKTIDEIVIATTTKEPDNPIVELCQRLNVSIFRGSEEDVLERYYGAAKAFQADVVVRLTSDCPLIDPSVIDRVVGYYLEHHDHYDYVSNTLERTYPRGLDTEVFSFKVLDKVNHEAEEANYREHVTAYIYSNPGEYRMNQVTQDIDMSSYRLTVDTEEDFLLISKIIEALYPKNPQFQLEDVYQLLLRHPEWKRINEHIEQKKL